MPITIAAPANEPLSDLLRSADDIGVDVQPDELPDSAAHLYFSIYDSLIPRLNLKREQRRRVALDTTIVLCAEHAGARLVPKTIRRVRPTLTRCFAVYGGTDAWVNHTLNVLVLFCRGGLDVPNLKLLAVRLRNERIRRAYRNGDDYDTLANRHDLTPMQIRRITAVRDF